jgi:hypothetical protein
MDRSDGLDQVSGAYVLQQVARGTCFQESKHVLIIVVGSEDQTGGGGTDRLFLFRRFNAVQLGHGDIHKDHVRMPLDCQFNSLQSIVSLSHNLKILIAFQKLPSTFPHKYVIVSKQNSDLVQGVFAPASPPNAPCDCLLICLQNCREGNAHHL